MPVLAICPFCLKTVRIERAAKIVCPDCGQTFTDSELKAKGLYIDSALEAKEFAVAKDWFINTEFMSAAIHFRKALDANKNSYLSSYFANICDIYLNENTPGYDIMESVIGAITGSLELLKRASVSVNDRLAFISAMMSETKIVIINKLRLHEELFETDIEAFRKEKIVDLKKLTNLFKLDGETLMTYSPNIAAVLTEIADCAIALCHRILQTVAIGEVLHYPTDEEYKDIYQLCNDFCFFATSLMPEYDVKKYTPDFEQNNLLIEKVVSRFVKYDAKNKPNAKRYITGDVDEYEDILAECEKAIKFTYLNCYKSLCDVSYSPRLRLIADSVKLVYRLLTPRVTIEDKKRVDMTVGKFVNVVDYYGKLSKFIEETAAIPTVEASLRAFYAKLHAIVEMYFTAEYDKFNKSVDKLKQARDDDFNYYSKFLFNTACCCAPALSVYVAFDTPKDKNRAKLVKLCKQASEEFLLLWDYKLGELEQSNIYRPILDIYNAVLAESE